jgi:drug/metabolite transporter (DMT)-like permease
LRRIDKFEGRAVRMKGQDWALLFLLSIFWGGSFFFGAVAVREVPPLTLVALRTGIATLTLLAILRMRGETLPIARGTVAAFAVMGLLNNLLPFSLLFWALTTIPSGLASILNATTPIFSIVVAHFVLADERMAKNKVVGILFGFAGVVVLVGRDAVGSADIASLGILACLCAALSYGFAGIFGRRFKAMHLSATQVAFGQLFASTILALPLVFALDTPWRQTMPSAAAIGSVLALAIVSTALAYAIFFRVLASAGAVNVALVTLLVPVSAILLGTLILSEDLVWQHFMGMGLIGIGLLAIDGRVLGRFGRTVRT